MDHRDIFISFSNKDRNKVEYIVQAIKYFGASCWYQSRDSKKDYLREINEGIKNSSAFVIFLSPDSIDSIMVRNEINRALDVLKRDRSFKILPVVIEELDEDEEGIIKLLLGSFNWLYEREYPDYYSLALAIFEQIDLHLETPDGVNSTYSGESTVEQKRIESQNLLFNEYAKQYLDEIFRRFQQPDVLDVGCSNGKNILLRLSGRDYGRLLGIDKDANRIREASQAYTSSRNTFLQCDITTEQLDETLRRYLDERGMAGFDLIHISAVLLHVKAPGDILRRLHGFLKDGGVIFIQDEDDGCNLVYPHAAFFDNCFSIWEHSLESGDRRMGRKIPIYLREAGYRQITLKSSTVSSLDFGGKYRETLWDLYFNPELWVVEDASYFDSYDAFSLLEEYRSSHPAFRKDYMDGKYFLTLGILFFTAEK